MIKLRGFVALFVSFTVSLAQDEPFRNPNLPIEQRVSDLLGRMTLEEKIAQITSTWQNRQYVEGVAQEASQAQGKPVSAEKWLFVDKEGRFVPERSKAILGSGMGQVTRPGENRGPRAEVEFENQVQHWVLENTRLRIPVMFHEECLHGHMVPKGTSYPVPIGLASTWNPELIQGVFTAVAAEARARGVHQCLAPVLDLARDPRWGRTEETYGEDPYLVTEMGVAAVRGYQGEYSERIDGQHVFATIKHFAVHGQPESGTNVGPGNYSERVIREFFFAPFKAAIARANAASLMASYNEVDGVPSHSNKWLLQDVLRQEFGFRGLVVSDYSGISDLKNLHHVAATDADAAKQAIEAGVDIELPLAAEYSTIADQVKNGAVSEADLDRAVANILRAKFKLGLFEHPFADPSEAERVTNSPEHQRLALDAAHQSIILLKNDKNLLPLDRTKVRTIAVIGPNAAKVHFGGYSDNPGRGLSILQGIKDKVAAGVKVTYAEGAHITESEADWNADEVKAADPKLDAERIKEAVRVARAANVAIVVVGENESTSREAWGTNHLGDRDSLDLLGRQDEMVAEILKTGVPTVVVLLHGRPNSINFIAEHVPAIVEGWYLGQEGGTAMADVLLGDYNPAGRLPITVPRSVGQLPDYYYQKPSARRGYLFADKSPLFAFGHGLSYTTFKYSNLRVTPQQIGIEGDATVSVDVTNTGSREGDDVAQLYIHDLVSSVTRPIKQLRGFKRVHIAPGQTATVQFKLTHEDLAFYNRQMQRVVEPGTFDIMVGPSSAMLTTTKLQVVAH